jgi:DNA adenine methylase
MSLPEIQLFYRQARPFLKWAGGKSQLIEQIAAHLPAELKQGRLRRYAEPFVGGGPCSFMLLKITGLTRS